MFGFPNKYNLFNTNYRVNQRKFNEFIPTSATSASCMYWIDAMREPTTTAHNTNTLPVNLSTYPVGYAQAASSGPLYLMNGLNNRPAYQFGSPRYLQTSQVPYYHGTFTIITVLRLNGKSALSCLFEYGPDLNGGYAGFYLFSYATTPEAEFSAITAGGTGIGGRVNVPALSDNAPRVVTMRLRGPGTSETMFDFRYNGTTPTRASSTNTGGGSTVGGAINYISIGRRVSGNAFYSNLFLSEFMLFDGALSDSEMTQIEKSLGLKWGIGIA